MTSLCLWRSFFRGKMNSSTRLVYKSCRNDGTSALKLAEIMWKNKLVTVVVSCFFIYEAGNFWNSPHMFSSWTWISQFPVSFLFLKDDLSGEVTGFVVWMSLLSLNQQCQSTEGNSKHWRNQWLGRLRCLGNLVISAFDLRLSGREFNFRPPRLILDGWLSLGGQTTSVFHRATQANSASCSQQDRKWVLATLCWSLCGWGVKAGWLIPCVHKRVGGR